MILRHSNIKIIHIIIFLLYLVSLNSPISAQNDSKIESLKSLINTFQYNEAIKLADNYLKEDSTNSKILFYKGKAQSAIYLYRNALTSYAKAYSCDSLNIDLLEEITTTYQLLNDNENAIRYCQKIIQLKPGNYFFKVQLANIFYLNLNYRESVKILLPLANNDSTNVYLKKFLGNCYIELKKYDSAVFYYKQAWMIMPDDVSICQKLTNLYIKTKEYEKGLVITNDYLKRDSLQADIILLKAYCFYLLKEYPLAMDLFMRSHELGKDTKFLYKYLGLSFYKLEEFGLAGKYLDMAYQKDTADAEIAFYLGVSSYKSLHTDTGIYYLNKTLELIMPGKQFLTTVYLEQAEAYNHLYKYDTALILIKKAYNIDSSNTTIVFRMAYQYDSWILDKKQAVFYYNKYLKLAKENNNDKEDDLTYASTIGFVNGRLEELNKIKNLK